MIENLFASKDLHSLARSKKRSYQTRTVLQQEVTALVEAGWAIVKYFSKTVRLRRDKPHSVLLEDRVWSLLHAMQFDIISGDGGAVLALRTNDPDSPTMQLDIVALDSDVALAVECKSQQRMSRRSNFKEDIGKFVLARERFTSAVRKDRLKTAKQQISFVMITNNIYLTDTDKKLASDANVTLIDQDDLRYFESLISHVGPAAKYQLLSELFARKSIPSLNVRVPAIRTRMGGVYCYTFSMIPSFLLKISYVAHRARSKTPDISLYQRMLSARRLASIKNYISDYGIFPTNIVINLEARRAKFEPAQQAQGTENSGNDGVLGWLDLKPAYRCAWIIDGQHRLFAYSGHERADKDRLSILAFDSLSSADQAKYFISINSKQKRVKQSLLQELYGEFHWDAEKPQEFVPAIISRAVRTLDSDPESSLYGRVRTTDSDRDDLRCISFEGLFSAIEKGHFYIQDERKGDVVSFGPLWAGAKERTLTRSVFVLDNWFKEVRRAVPDWWDKGRAEGGGLAMNDGVTGCINVLSSVLRHLDSVGKKTVTLSDDDVFEELRRFADSLGTYLASLDSDQRLDLRRLRGVQGQTVWTRRCQAGIRRQIAEFSPEGLEKFIEEERNETNTKGRELIERLERRIQKIVIEELKREFSTTGDQWWYNGVPVPVRKLVSERQQEDGNQRGGFEYYFDLIHYRPIVLANWSLFGSMFGSADRGGKDNKTRWMVFVNEKRNSVSHFSSGVRLTLADLERLTQIEDEFNRRLVADQNREALESDSTEVVDL